MKKIFFFIWLFFIMGTVNAETMKHFEVLNGKLSIPFDSKINTYTVYLIDGESQINANYILMDDALTATIDEDREKAVYKIFNGEKEVEEYVFYKITTEETPVFNEKIIESEPPKEIPNLPYYIIGTCLIIIIILFKIIVIGFKRKI